MALKQIPILLNFDSSKTIGVLHVDESLIPIGHDYVFALAYHPGKTESDDELCAVSLMSDKAYREYLDSDKYQGSQTPV